MAETLTHHNQHHGYKSFLLPKKKPVCRGINEHDTQKWVHFTSLFFKGLEWTSLGMGLINSYHRIAFLHQQVMNEESGKWKKCYNWSLFFWKDIKVPCVEALRCSQVKYQVLETHQEVAAFLWQNTTKWGRWVKNYFSKIDPKPRL